jgi:hypothetical protein
MALMLVYFKYNKKTNKNRLFCQSIYKSFFNPCQIKIKASKNPLLLGGQNFKLIKPFLL